jgi:hypothetical protein
MSSQWLIPLLAETEHKVIPNPIGLVFFFLVGVVSAFGLFASSETLKSMSGIIGTKNPLVARIACGFGVLTSLILVAVSVLVLLGKLNVR